MPSSAVGNAPARGRLPVAARDRRPALAALALLLVLVGALGSALIVFRSGDRISVLAARGDIAFGQKVTTGDFKVVRVAADDVPLLRPSQLDSLATERAVSSIPAGSLVSPAMFTPDSPVPGNGVAVGVVVDATRRPSSIPAPGQVVRVYAVTGDGTSAGTVSPGTTVVNGARVLSIGPGGSAGSRSITILVTKALAPKVANLASSGNLAVSTLADGSKPDIDTAED